MISNCNSVYISSRTSKVEILHILLELYENSPTKISKCHVLFQIVQQYTSWLWV
jgi:hypothetical protein